MDALRSTARRGRCKGDVIRLPAPSRTAGHYVRPLADHDIDAAGSVDPIVIGRVESTLADVASAPKQGNEGGPEAWLAFEARFADGLRDLRPGDRIVVLTWLHRARRDVLRVHPRDDATSPETGVFSTRSADRPNPIGLHPVEILAVDGVRLLVANLEAVDGTPILDVKPLLS